MAQTAVSRGYCDMLDMQGGKNMKTRRMISLLLSAVLMLALLPVTALAAGTWNGGMTPPAEGDGSSGAPYQIGTAEELAWFAAQVNGGNAGIHARLTDDIVLNNTSGWQNWGTSAPANTWTPIGNSSNRFAGTFDGAGHTVSGVYTVGSGAAGFFGYVGVGTVKNVTVAASHIAGYDNVGGVCGINYGGSFINCHNRGDVVAGGSYIGGIIGQNLKGTVTGCYNYGSVRGGTDVGGICGVSTGAESPGSLITGCGNAGVVTGTTKYVGGIVGGLSAATASSVIENSYNTGPIQGPQGTFQGGICGISVSGSTSNCYYLNTSSTAGIGNGSGPVSKTAAQFASGEVAYLLGAQFGQTLGPGGDTVPMPRRSDNANQVFKLTYLNGAEVHAVQYYNSGSTVSTSGITAPVSGDGYFSGWEGLPETMPAQDVQVSAVFGSPIAPVITTESLPDAVKGVQYTAQIEATGTAPITFSVSAGSLPAGLTLNGTTGVISGTPTAEGVSTFTVRAANSTGVQDTQELSITVFRATPAITTGSLPSGVLGTPYSQTITATGRTPITFSVTAGSLPAGLTLNGITGVISGTPSAAGTSTFTVQAANQAGTDAKQLTITVEVQMTGNGTASNPYRIATAEHLLWFAQQVNGGRTDIHGIQVADIALNDTAGWENWGSAAPANLWTPIGTGVASRFMGSFNGQNHTISGIYINSTGDCQGLFGYIGTNTLIQNVRITKSYIKGNSNVGAICGAMVLSTIRNCYNSGTVVTATNYAGGICGYVNTNNTIENCQNAGTVVGAGTTGPAAVGGIVGGNSGMIKNCCNTGTVTSSNSGMQNQFGGVAGSNYGQIQHCYNTGAVNVPDKNNVGGICGYNNATIQYCYNTGAVVGKSNVGSICGLNPSSGTVNACYFLSPPAGIGNNMGTSTAEVRSAGAFASGEVAYLLGAQFGQTLGPDGGPAPVFRTTDPSNAVYRLTYMNGDNIHATQYYNTGAAVSAQGIATPTGPDGAFIGWDGLPETMPAGDVTVLAVFGSANTPPAAKDPVPVQSMLTGGGASFDADDIAQDADDDDLTITAMETPLDTGVATAALQNGTVTVTGMAAGNTSVQVTVSDGTDTVDVVVPITVTARTYTLAWAVPAPDFAALTYGYGTGSSATFTVKNTGNSEVTGIAAAITAGGNSFEITALLSADTLAPGETAAVTVASKTGLSAAGSPHTGTLTVTWNEGDGGTGIGRALSQTVNKATQAAPDASLFTVKDESVSGRNDGSIGGVTDTMEYRPGASGDYTAVPDGATSLTGLVPGEYSIRYRETSNYLTGPDTIVTVGKGAEPTYTITAAPAQLNFGSVRERYPAPAGQKVVVTNTGNSPVTLQKPQSAKYNVTGAAFPVVIEAGEKLALTVQPKTGLRDGTYDETIVFATEQGTKAEVRVRFTVMGPVTAIKTIIKTMTCIIRTIGSIFGW